MFKWQEIALTGLINFSIALLAGSMLKLVFDEGALKPAVASFAVGFGFYVLVVIFARLIEKRGNG